jgi:hypothetical protein
MTNYAEIIEIMYQGSRVLSDFELMYVDDTLVISRWDIDDNPPTIEELDRYAKTLEYQERFNVRHSLDYRKDRAREYIEQLSPEQKFETSVGDLLDAIIKAIYGDSKELDEYQKVIKKIKKQYPAS